MKLFMSTGRVFVFMFGEGQYQWSGGDGAG